MAESPVDRTTNDQLQGLAQRLLPPAGRVTRKVPVSELLQHTLARIDREFGTFACRLQFQAAPRPTPPV